MNNLFNSSGDKKVEDNKKIENNKTELVHDIKEDIIKEDEELTMKSPRKEIVEINNDNDIDETSSLANFFNDIKDIAENKGIKVEETENKYSLFEDASIIENKL